MTTKPQEITFDMIQSTLARGAQFDCKGVNIIGRKTNGKRKISHLRAAGALGNAAQGKRKEEKKNRALDILRENPSLFFLDVAAMVGISRGGWDHWIKKDADFKEALYEIKKSYRTGKRIQGIEKRLNPVQRQEEK